MPDVKKVNIAEKHLTCIVLKLMLALLRLEIIQNHSCLMEKNQDGLLI